MDKRDDHSRASETIDQKKDMLEEAIERVLFTPRRGKKRRANAFLQDWMRRFGR